jgi:hypothetical protein
MLEAALEQMDGIIQGAKYELPHQFDNIAIQVRGPTDQWLRIRDVYPGSWIGSFPSRIQGQKDSRSASKNLSIFNPKNCF